MKNPTNNTGGWLKDSNTKVNKPIYPKWLPGMHVMLEDLTEHEMAIVEDWMRGKDCNFIGHCGFDKIDGMGRSQNDYDYVLSSERDMTTRITAKQAMDIVESNK